MKIKKKNNGQVLWSKAKKLIVGGNMLLSKRPEMYAPDQWPSYYKKAKKCYVVNPSSSVPVSVPPPLPVNFAPDSMMCVKNPMAM